MRELDTETSVVWPAWCYQSGEITSESSPQTASSPSLQISPHAASANGNLSNSENHSVNSRAKRKPIHNTLQYSVDKMLNERNKIIESNKNILYGNNDNYNNSLMTNNSCMATATTIIPFDDKLNIKNSSDNNMNFIKNGQLSPSTAQKLSQITLSKCLNASSNNNNNNNSKNINGSGTIGVKAERLSPPLVNDLSIYRSRSVTPQSSHISTATPPQQSSSSNLMSNPNISCLLSSSTAAVAHLGSETNNGSTQNQELPPLNYSSMMRTLAAKYNNSNDLPTPKNSFSESRIKSNRESSIVMDQKPNSPPQFPSNQNLLTSLFSSLQFNQNNIFNPMLDMGSTRALVLLARAAQEAEMQNLMKEAEKPRKMSFPSTSLQMPNLGSHNGFTNPFPALTNLQALHQLSTRSPPAPPSNTSTTQAPYQSPVNENTTGISPLDLSSSNTPPLAKRIKLSPTTTEVQAQRLQLTTSPNVTTTNNQLSTSTSGFSTLSSSSSSTTSNNSEQTGTALPTRKCQMKINEINAWNVNEVCSFVEGIAICAEYVNNFREQSIDGEGLMMLTEEHLINILGMKLGPALKLIKSLKRLNENCNCSSAIQILSSSNGDENYTSQRIFINNFKR
ncbi:hypothetical protein PVAND_006342 [Polypedilum vanderplanki]|uniref:SAM domain-containing protein n=1 Tax=Polypedilum vanderplanki TaxID=319348 RepID=A0A9J6C3S1_POLVA|nr:hypothetical protein PVAND_006342 [Polypedilum vanderplanki]